MACPPLQGAPGAPLASSDDELLALTDPHGRPLAWAARRAIVHRDGLWHRSFHCWLVRPGLRGPLLLLQRRSLAKATWPGAWDVSAAGHYGAGEGLAGGCRELAEELGVVVAPEALVWLGRHREVLRYGTGLRDREYQDVYLLRDERPLAAYAPDPREVTGLALVDAWALVALAAGHTPRLRAIAWLWDGNRWDERQVAVRRGELVTRAGTYYRWVARGAARLLHRAATAARGAAGDRPAPGLRR